MKRTLVLVIAMLFAIVANAQHSTPRTAGAKPVPPVTATTTQPPAATNTAPPAATTTVAPQPAAPATDTDPVVHQSEMEKYLSTPDDKNPVVWKSELNSYAKTRDLPNFNTFASKNDIKDLAPKSDIPSVGWLWLFVIVLIVAVVVLSIMKRSVSKNEIRSIVYAAIENADDELKSEINDTLVDMQSQLAQQNIKITVVELNTTAKAASVPSSTGTRKVVPAIVIGLIGLIAAGHSQAATSPCTIKSTGTTGVVIQGEATTVTISTNGCDVKSLEIGAAGLIVTDLVSSNNGITAKVTADANAEKGSAAFQLTLSDGTVVVSPKTTWISVFEPQVADARADGIEAAAQARKDALAASAKVASNTARIAKQVKELKAEVKAMPTKAEISATLQPVLSRLCDLEKVVSALKDQADANATRVAVIGQATEALAEGQQVLANAKVKKGFWGRATPLNPEVAAAADRIRLAIADLK